jgi:hypothetical protein
MQRLLAVVVALVLGLGCGAQRHVRVQLDDGETFAGTVVAMDLASLQVRVGDEVRTIDAARIRSCRFDEPDGGDVQQPAGDAKSAATAASANAQPDAPPNAPRITWRGPLQDPVDPTAAAQPPHDLRGRSRLRQRLELLDERYPWLAPSHPSQWVSIGLLLAILSSFAVYHSVRIAGAEGASFGRGALVAGWYLFSGALQLAAVPCNDLSVVLMLLANPTLALFWLSGLFGMTRLGASIALAIQLGIGVLAFGVLELITAVLGSIGTPIT